MVLSLIFFVLLAFSVVNGEQILVEDEHLINIDHNRTLLLNKFLSLGLMFDRHDIGIDTVKAYALDSHLVALSEQGFNYSKIENTILHTHKKEMEKAKRISRKRQQAYLDWGYHNYESLTNFLQRIATQYSSITKLYSIGKSVEGRELWVMDISKNPDLNEVEPEFKYVGNMHGDEVVGREILLHFIEYLVSNYGKDNNVTSMIDSIHISILPTMNPDGFERARRSNANGWDLNRNFPDQYITNTGKPQPEVKAIMDWCNKKHYVLSVNFHGGSMVANYPWDGVPSAYNTYQMYSAAPDDEIFRQLAVTYANSHRRMWKSTEFPGGITNGAAWYVLYGGMQDWNYIERGTMELTVELTYTKYPSASTLRESYDDNLPALVNYMKAVKTGIWGVVYDAKSNARLSAKISVQRTGQTPIQKAISTDPENGDYYRLVAPGNWNVTASAEGKTSKSQTVTVDSENSRVRLDFAL